MIKSILALPERGNHYELSRSKSGASRAPERSFWSCVSALANGLDFFGKVDPEIGLGGGSGPRLDEPGLELEADIEYRVLPDPYFCDDIASEAWGWLRDVDGELGYDIPGCAGGEAPGGREYDTAP